jgi:hypothetical protein
MPRTLFPSLVPEKDLGLSSVRCLRQSPSMHLRIHLSSPPLNSLFTGFCTISPLVVCVCLCVRAHERASVYLWVNVCTGALEVALGGSAGDVGVDSSLVLGGD